MKTTKDIILLINALCLCTKCNINGRLNKSKICCQMNRISKDIIYKGEY